MLTFYTDADGQETEYKYDLSLNTASMIDRNGNETRYNYDNRGLLTEKKVAETGDKLSYTYDVLGNRETMTDETGTSTYLYNENNWLVSIDKNEEPQVSYAYDEIGNIINITDKQGNTTEYTYDKSSRMETVSFNSRIISYEYDENGNRRIVSYDGELEEIYTYDKNNRLLKLVNKNIGGSEISSYIYTFDKAGRQASKTDSYGTTEYSYDNAGRILKVEAPGKTTLYAYDNAGNRLSQDETYTSEQVIPAIDGTGIGEIKYIVKRSEYIYSNTNRLLKLVEKMKDAEGIELMQKITIFSYDSNGNELRKSVEYISLYNNANPKAYEAAVYSEDTTAPIHAIVDQTISHYDGFNRLVKTELIKATIKTIVEYAYDGDGLRVEKTVKRSDKGNTAEVTSYLYDRQHVILETRGSEDIQYVRGINYIARIDNTDKLSYFMYNGHGDVVQTVSENGVIENQYDYDIFGNPTLTLENYMNNIRYAGEFYDSETGLYYLRARYYDPYIGRFISEDSYWGEDTSPLSLNLYTYCHNDPIQFIDPSGHSVLGAIGGAIGGLIGGAGGAAVGAAIGETANYVIGTGGYVNSDDDNDNGNDDDDDDDDDDRVTVTWEGYIIDISESQLEEYESHGWGLFNGEAYADNMYNSSDLVDTITVADGSNVTIHNYGEIGTVNTGEGSYTVIDNDGTINKINTGVGSTAVVDNEGTVDVINTGASSHTEMRNREEGKIDEINGGEKSSLSIFNYGSIEEIRTGKESDNLVFNLELNDKKGYIASLITGEGNHTTIYASHLEFVKSELQKGKIEFYDTGSQGTGETEFWSQQGYFDNFWWQDEEKLNKAIAELEYIINTTGGIDLSKVRDPNIMAAIQRLSGSLTTKVYGVNTYETIQVIQAKYNIEGNAMILDKATFDAMLDRYNKGLIGQEFGDFAERTEFAYVVDAGAYAMVAYASMVPKVKGMSKTQQVPNANAGNYLAKKAPNQVTPGTRVLEGQYVDDLGRVQPWKAYYDEYGRLVGRTDYNAGNKAAGIPDTHYHTYEWGPGKTPYESGSHIKGEYKP